MQAEESFMLGCPYCRYAKLYVMRYRRYFCVIIDKNSPLIVWLFGLESKDFLAGQMITQAELQSYESVLPKLTSVSRVWNPTNVQTQSET